MGVPSYIESTICIGHYKSDRVFRSHLVLTVDVDKVLAKLVMNDRRPGLFDNCVLRWIRFKAPGSVTAHRASSDVVQHPRCQVVCPLDEETRLEIGLPIWVPNPRLDSFEKARKPNNLIRRFEDCNKDIRQGYQYESLPTDLQPVGRS